MASGQDVIDLCRSKIGQWRYVNDYPDRLYPEEYGGTDCSGMVRWAYGKLGYDVGTWTGDESHAGREIARGYSPSEIPWDDMLPGDLILMTAKYPGNFEFNAYLCHIELYCGGGTMIGHPGGYGPQEKWAQAWMEAYGCATWMVRRVIEEEDEMITQEDIDKIAAAVWAKQVDSEWLEGSAQDNLVIVLRNTNELARTDDPTGRGSEATMQQRLAWVGKRLDDVEAKLDEIAAKLA